MPLRILVLCKTFSEDTETFIYQDVLSLQKQHHVTVACLVRKNQDKRPFPVVVQLQTGGVGKWKRLWRSLLRRSGFGLDLRDPVLRRSLQKVIHEFEPDVIHAHFGNQAVHFIDNMDFDGPVFVTFHGHDATRMVKQRQAYRKRLRDIFHRENIFPLSAAQSLVDIFHEYNLFCPRLQVLFCGVNIDFFSPASTVQDGPKPETRFIQVSAFREKKGHQFTLDACRLLRQKHPDFNFRLILVGEGPLLAPMKQHAQDLGISDRVDFLGWVDPVGVKALLATADVLVHPSVTARDGDMESIPTSLMEGMAMELPVFSTYHSGIPELVEHGVNGLLAAEKDVEAYANCLLELSAWGRLPHNRDKVLRDFSQQAHVRKLERAYEGGIHSLED